MDDVGIRLRPFGLAGRRRGGDQIRDAGDLQQLGELIGLRRAGDHNGIAVFGETQHQVADARKRRKVRQVAIVKNLAATLADTRALAAVMGYAGNMRHQLVAAHADGAAYPLGGHVEAGFVEGVDPGVGVGVVAVDERAVDVEDDRERCHGGEKTGGKNLPPGI